MTLEEESKRKKNKSMRSIFQAMAEVYYDVHTTMIAIQDAKTKAHEFTFQNCGLTSTRCETEYL